MNKTSVLPLLMFALVVSGCTSTPKKKKTTSSPEQSSKVDPTSGETPTSQQPSPTSSAGPSSSSTVPASSSSVVPPSGEFTVTILTAGQELENYTNWSPTGGVAINGEKSGKANLEKLTNWCIQSCGYDGCVASLECTNIYAQYQLYDNQPHSSLILGTNKSSGTFTWNSSLSINKVEVTVKPYYKYVEYTDTWNHDEGTTVLIDTDSHELENAAEIPDAQVVSKTYSTPVKSFSLANTTNGRIFVDQIKITFQN